MPMVVASGTLVLALVGLVRDSLTKGGNLGPNAKSEESVLVSKAGTTSEAAGKDSRGEWVSYLVQMGWLFGFILSIYVVGLTISLILFVLSYMKWLGCRWWTATVSAVVLTAFLYGLFVRILDIDFYPGLVFSLYSSE